MAEENKWSLVELLKRPGAQQPDQAEGVVDFQSKNTRMSDDGGAGTSGL